MAKRQQSESDISTNMLLKFSESNKTLRQEIELLKKKHELQINTLEAENKKLQNNLSKLFNTAKQEKEKSRQKINELEHQIDDLLFSQFKDSKNSNYCINSQNTDKCSDSNLNENSINRDKNENRCVDTKYSAQRHKRLSDSNCEHPSAKPKITQLDTKATNHFLKDNKLDLSKTISLDEPIQWKDMRIYDSIEYKRFNHKMKRSISPECPF